MANGFVSGLHRWLLEVSALPVHIAADGAPMERSAVYLAPDGCDLEVSNEATLRVNVFGNFGYGSGGLLNSFNCESSFGFGSGNGVGGSHFFSSYAGGVGRLRFRRFFNGGRRLVLVDRHG